MHNNFGVDTSHLRRPQGSLFLATLGFDSEARWDIKPSTAMRSPTEADGRIEEPAAALGIELCSSRAHREPCATHIPSLRDEVGIPRFVAVI